MRGRRYEISSRTFDPTLQAIGADPWGTAYGLGVAIPPTPPPTNDFKHRYLIQLARLSLNVHQKGRIVGLRQFVEIGTDVATGGTGSCVYPVRRQVESPNWRFVDGNISWHLMRINTHYVAQDPTRTGESQAFLYSEGTAALLVLKAPGDIGGYVPPGSGIPIGTVAIEDLGAFGDMRFPWQGDQAQFSLDFDVMGPGDFVLFASVQQTNPSTRCVLPTPDNLSVLSIEDQFVIQYPTAVYTRVGGSIVVELDNFMGDPSEMDEEPLTTRITP
jgi:hypothetical protein